MQFSSEIKPDRFRPMTWVFYKGSRYRITSAHGQPSSSYKAKFPKPGVYYNMRSEDGKQLLENIHHSDLIPAAIEMDREHHILEKAD